MKLLDSILGHIPRRRKRFWRYVSPQRRGVGLGLLALVVTVAYGYWYLTNDDRVRRMARDYLAEVTGWRAEVDRAHFTLFSGIELQGVRVYLPAADVPLLETPLVILRNRPWGLFFRQRLDVTHIVCPGAAVTLLKDARTGKWEIQRALSGVGGGGGMSVTDVRGALPELLARDARVRVDIAHAGLRVRGKPIRVDLFGAPIEKKKGYSIWMAQRRDGPTSRPVDGGSLPFVKMEVDLVSGAFTARGEGRLLDVLSYPVLRPLERWKDRYKIDGRTVVVGHWDAKEKTGEFKASFTEVSLQLPPEEGGFRLAKVEGESVFTEDGVRVSRVTGRCPQAGNAHFSLVGRYDGYDANSPFEATIRLTGMTIPKDAGGGGPVAAFLAHLQRKFRPEGRWDLHAELKRDARGDLTMAGKVTARGAALTERSFAYRVGDVAGNIDFTMDRVDVHLVGRHGGASIKIDGHVLNPFESKEKEMLHVRVRAKDVALDRDLAQAIPKEFSEIWDRFSPRGHTNLDVRVSVDTPGGPQRIEIDILPDGGLSLSYKGFPYRLNNVSGEIYFTPERTRIVSLISRDGATRCTIDGSVVTHKEGDAIDLNVRARMPLDEKLSAALGRRGQKLFAAMKPTGMAEKVDVRVRQRPGKEVDYTAKVRVKNAGFTFDRFPYPIMAVDGALVITPRRIDIHGLRGRHGPARISVDGNVFIETDPAGLNLSVKAVGIVMDPVLLAALPRGTREIVEELSVKGSADVTFDYRENTPQAPGVDTYTAVVHPRKMQFRPRTLPILFRGVTGEVIVVPGRLKFNNLTSVEGKMKARLDGEVLLGDEARSADLKVQAENVPLTRELIAALTDAQMPLLSSLRPKGTCSLDLRSLKLRRSEGGPATRPVGTRPAATGPAGGGGWLWSLDGTIGLQNADLDLAIGRRTVTGALTGVATRTERGLAVRAEVAIDEFSLSGRTLTALRGKLIKKPAGEILKISDLVGKCHGGVLSGTAEIRLADPVQYGIRLSIEDVDLNNLFNAGVTDPKKRTDLQGKLGGVIQLMATEGPKPDRQAAGRLRISRGKLVKIPILLDLVNVMYLSLPRGWAFKDGYLVYHLRGNTLLFEEIHLVGSALSVVGSGTIDVDTERLNLTFLTGPPGKLPRISALAEEFLRGILREIVEYRVTGTLTKPRRQAVPLRAVGKILEALLSPGK